ncbi:MAG: AAA family ATPase [Bacteroidales bacterium]|nr:AAA family ATPase [Bacteroidales bacterium]
MERLLDISNRLIKLTEKKFVRSLFHKINWKHRLIEIRGARGVGKTTLLLQKALELKEKGENILYVSTDNTYFYKNKIVDLADYFYKYGGKYLFIDEVHKYPEKEKGLDWSQEIKNIYDSYPDLFVVYTGSSILQLYKGSGDLSRRKSSYHLAGLSFREYLEYNNFAKLPAYNLEDILSNHLEYTQNICKKIKILPHFKNYLRVGYFPFYNEDENKFFDRLTQVTNIILETDVLAVSDITYEVSLRLKKLLSLLSSSVPYTPNLSKLAEQLHIGHYRTLIKYLNYLEKAELIKSLSAKPTGDRILNKPDKIFLDNTNLMYGLADATINQGTLRETFLFNQLSELHKVSYPKTGDFLVDNKYLIEVGSKKKNKKQIADIPQSYIAVDDIETGFGPKIPLWLFGFLY